MSKMAELDAEIRSLLDEGLKPVSIAGLLRCPLEMVYDVMESDIDDSDAYDIVSYDDMFGDDFDIIEKE